MRITVFTRNQPRHVALIESLAQIAETVFAVQECNTVFPGEVADFFRKSPIMQDHFARVIAAETKVFGTVRFPPVNVHQLPLRMGDLNLLHIDALGEALQADRFIVFGASYIKGPLAEYLVARRAINIHMGMSPWYRGSSTNFWAMYDRRPQYVGATIHLLSQGLDSGPMLFHALPPAAAADPFVHGMLAVRAAHEGLIESLRSEQIDQLEPVPQDRSRELRYTKNADFTDEVAAEYLSRLPAPEELARELESRKLSDFLRPWISSGS
jgi:hypothetical protein